MEFTPPVGPINFMSTKSFYGQKVVGTRRNKFSGDPREALDAMGRMLTYKV
ncbi:hypothetical protein BOTU111922_22850 [Bordetella tumulicola]